MEYKHKILSVSEVNNYIKLIMDHDPLLTYIWIRGEISNFKLHYSGHMYMTLKDAMGTMKAVMFKSSNSRLRFQPDNGMKIIALGRVSVYEKDGQYQLYIEDMQPDGVGALHIAFEQLKEKLLREGLFEQERKKPLPSYPAQIGIVTSPTGAAIRDMLNVLKRRYPCAKAVLFPVLVQGDQAAGQIAEAISYFNRKKNVDIMIIGRGGGSIEELWAFNEEQVARAIAASDIPVISAVGHETDFTIADFAADLRAPTPSAAAELAVPSLLQLEEKLNQLSMRMAYSFRQGLEYKRARLNNTNKALNQSNPIDKIYQNRIRLDGLIRLLMKNTNIQIARQRELLGVLCGKLNTLSPLGVLARGYAIVGNQESNAVSSVQKIAVGEDITVQLSDGFIGCTVKRVESHK